MFTPNDAGLFFGASLYGISYGNDLFVAVGEAGTVITSSDGTDWDWVQQQEMGDRRIVAARGLVDSAPAHDIYSSLYGVAYGNGMFVAVGEHGYNPVADDDRSIYSSVDGSSWSPVEWLTDWEPAFNAFRSIAYLGGRFVSFGDYADDGDPLVVMTSTDGAVWTEGIVPLILDEHFSAPVYGNGVYVAVGDQGTVITSSDGTSWADTGDFTSTIDPFLYAVAYANGTFVAVGYDNGNLVSLILLSSDGITWTTQDMPLAQGVYLYGVTSGTAGFVAVGHDPLGSGGSVVLTSANGRSWAAQRWDHKARNVGWGPMDGGLYVVVMDYNPIPS